MRGNVTLSESPRVLLVEDDADFSDAISALLTQAGFYVMARETAASAYRTLATDCIDLILLDLSLPDGRGCEVISPLLSLQPRCAVVVLTGHNDAGLAVR